MLDSDSPIFFGSGKQALLKKQTKMKNCKYRNNVSFNGFFFFSCNAGNLQVNWKIFKSAFLLGSYAVSNVAMNNYIFGIKQDQSKLFSYWILS